MTYTFYRSLDGSSWTQIYSGPESEYRDTGLTPDTEYFYKGSLTNPSGTSWTDVVSRRTRSASVGDVVIIRFAKLTTSVPELQNTIKGV